MHITAFGLKLDKEQKLLKLLGIYIRDKDKIQFYMEKIYASNMFDKKEMVNWENKLFLIKHDYNKATLYFKNLVKDFKTYTQNSSGTSSKQGYKSANMAANVGNKLRRYIQEIVSAAAAGKESAANISKETKTKDAHICAMTMQIKTLTDAIAALMKSLANKGNTPPNTGNMNSVTTNRTFNWTCNMGAYCWSHGNHPVGAKHTSCSCTKKKKNTSIMRQPQTAKEETISGP
jgi:hypothetical protein